jgi:hypothetical protein
MTVLFSIYSSTALLVSNSATMKMYSSGVTCEHIIKSSPD